MAASHNHNHPSQEQEPPNDYALPIGMARAQFHAMGTTVSLLLPEEQVQVGTEAVQSLFAEWEQTLSRFMPESELSRLNSRAGHSVAVSPLLFMVLEKAIAAAQATDGLYDPTLLQNLHTIGYDRSFELIENASVQVNTNGHAVRKGGAWQQIRLNHEKQRVTLPVGVGVEFGGIAKGMAVDAALERLRDVGIATAMVNAGGDLAVLGVPPIEQQWDIAVPGKTQSWTLPLTHGAIATSGIARRHWQQGEQQRHHLLDARTGLPAQSGMWSVTVVAATCMQAEVAAKVAFVLGIQEGSAFLQQRGLPGMLIRENGNWTTAGPWPVEVILRGQKKEEL